MAYSAEDLDRDATALYGTTAWRAKLGRDLGVSERTIRRHLEAGSIPEWVRLAIIGLRAEAIAAGAIKKK